MEKLKDQTDDLLDDTKNNNDSSTAPKNKRDLLITITLVTGVFVGASSSGMAIGYSAVLLPQLKLNSSAIPIDDHMGSWIASILTGSMPIGSVISAIIIDKIGRVRTFKIQSVVVSIAWIIVACAQSYEIMLLGRFTAGVASGIGVVVGQVYFTEVCRPNIRGILSAGPFISYSIGILIVYALGAVLPWRLVAGLSTAPGIIAFIIYSLLPESHIWLVKQNRTEEAIKSLTWFRANNVEETQNEIKQIISRFEHQKTEERINYRIFFEPQVLKPLCITIVLNILQTLSGVYIVVFYAIDIISNIGIEDLEINDMLVALITALVRMLFTVVFCVLLVYMSRRSFTLISGVSGTVFSFILGTCLYFNIKNYFIPVCLVIYVAATVGLLLLPGIMLGELFPIKARGVAGGLSHTIYSISIFGVAKAYPFFKENLKIYGIFWLFSLSSFLLSVIAFLVLPETKSSTLLEIEDYFLGKNLFWMNRKRKTISKENAAQCDKLNSSL
ncbi:hypothetical protein RN001_011926 [Aquatica leii]|uniref:Major facilitator superfamily (MFS) profile domain-containing protein n=1 Tax=Aquatica leii TaxID=1421715 RepID=A0AAN7SEW0_9COLE|nr:hypothetical protein RN001_011926 [Aquatica leii]